MYTKKLINKTKEEFEKDFSMHNYMERRTYDDEQLDKILSNLRITENSKILDLGTGAGYIAFSIAEKYKSTTIIGLDILDKTLKRNNEKAINKNLTNIKFINYDGFKYPFDDNSFDIIVTRYAIHHFPNIDHSFSEIKRILKSNGQLFISDPTPNKNDIYRFVDLYMQLKEDGHIKFYTFNELINLANKYNFKLDDYFISKIIFETNKSGHPRFKSITKNVPKEVIDGYMTFINGQEYTTEEVLNISFTSM